MTITETVDLAMSVEDAQLERLLSDAGRAGDQMQVALCLIALQRTEESWQRECLDEVRARLERIGVIPEHIDADVLARAECARVIRDAGVQS